MGTSDEHLEATLKEYNDKVNDLEDNGTPLELLDAYINRGCVLSMMEYYVSAMSDFDDAIDIIENADELGIVIDAGSFVKAYVSRGDIRGADSTRDMADDYGKAAVRLKELDDGSKYYNTKGIVRMCLSCSENLIDESFPLEATPFIDKSMSLIVGKDDGWSRNRYVETLNLDGQVLMETERTNEALECFSNAIDIGNELLSNGCLDDMMSLVFAYVSRGDLEQQAGLTDPYFIDRKAAILLLEEMMATNRLDDVEILVELHQDIANTYVSLNKLKEAEEHLMKQVVLNMDGAQKYIREFSDRKME